MKVDITVWHLEMHSRSELTTPNRVRPAYQLVQATIPCPEFNRFFYTAVGGEWFWIDRLSWNYDRWVDWLDRPELETWVGYLDGTPFGYFEIEQQQHGDVELSYFGLLPAFTGNGLGGHFLTDAVRRMWEMGAARVWVHTCSKDHPSAVANYQARGFKLFKTEMRAEELPDLPPGPWPGAHRPDSNSAT